MISRARKFALGGVVGTVVVTAISILGPELFSSWWNSEREKAQSENQQIQLEAIREQTEVMSNLRDAITALQDDRRPPSPATEAASPDLHRNAAATSTAQDEPVEEPKAAALPAAGALASQAEPEVPAIVEPPATEEETVVVVGPVSLPQFGEVVGVFENEPFALCSHEEFRASLREGGADGERLHLSSRNRSVPGAGFRGYETLLPLEQPVELWEGCVVAAAVKPSPGGRRILISMGEQ